MQAIKQLHPDVIASVQAKTLFSREEETLLGKVASVSGISPAVLGQFRAFRVEVTPGGFRI